MKHSELHYLGRLSAYTLKSVLIRLALVSGVGLLFFFLSIKIMGDSTVQVTKLEYFQVVLIFNIISEMNVLIDHLSERFLPITEKISLRVVFHFVVSLIIAVAVVFYFSLIVKDALFFSHPIVQLMMLLGLIFIFIITIFSITLRIIEKWIYSVRQLEELKSLKLKSDYNSLQTQLNPHFLFNALNNIYSLSQQGSAKTPKLVLKLSSMLRFIVYETDEKKIPIGREIDYIRDFIEFQKIKLEEKPNLAIDFNLVDRDIRIEPMLIFPFFENAFKHGNIGDTKNGWIKAFLKAKDGQIMFSIANSKPAGYVSKDKSKGIGIENVKKRLSFLYKGSYRLNIIDKQDVFKVQMEIETL